ncbi:MAG: phage tail length tape measure family protein [Caulobacteraceae bacterium]|nr:phage tail length tape measure family protein [Caulobacteraceae bacterium]
MPTTSVAIRVGTEGKADVKRDFQEIGQAGNAAMDGLASAAERAAQVAERAAARQRTAWQAQAQAAHKAMVADYAQRDINGVLGVRQMFDSGAAARSAAVFEEVMRAQDQLAERTRNLKAQIDPLWVAQERLNRAEAEATDLLRAGTITTAEHTAAVARAKGVYAETAAHLRRHGEAAGFNRAQLMELTHVARASFDAIAAGANPLQVLAMESGRAYQALSSGQGGLAGGIAALGAFINPATVSIAALAGGLAVAGAAALMYQSATEKLSAAAEGFGRRAGATGAQLERTAEAGARAARISVGAAREMEAAFLHTGTIGSAVFEGLIGVSKNYATAMGVNSKKAGEELASIFASPSEGAVRLNEKLALLDDKTLHYIQTLALSSDKTAAQSALLRTLQHDLDGASEHVDALKRAMDRLNVAGSTALTWLGRVMAPTTQDRLDDLIKQRSNLLPFQSTAKFDVEIARLQKEQADEQSKIASSRLNYRSANAGQIANKLLGFDRREKLEEQLNELKAGAAAGRDRFSAEGWERTQTAIDAQTHALKTWMPAYEKAQRLSALDAKIAEAKTPAEKAALAAQRERIQLSGEFVTASAAEASAQDKANKARSEAAKSGAGHAQTLARESAAMAANAAGALDLARAYLVSDAAAMVAEARRKATTDAARKGADVELRIRQQLSLAVSEQAAQGAKAVADLTAQTAGQRAVNDAMAAGVLGREQADAQLRVEMALRPLVTAQTVAHVKGLQAEEAALAQLIDRTKTAMIQADEQAHRKAVLQAIDTANDNLTIMREELRLIGATNAVRAVALAQKRAEIELDGKGIAKDSPDGQAYIKARRDEAALGADIQRAQYVEQTSRDQQNNLEMLALERRLLWASAGERDREIEQLRIMQQLKLQGIDATSAEGQAILRNADLLTKVNHQLAVERATQEELRQTGEAVIDDLGSALSGADWGNWADAGRRALQDIQQEFVKLSLLNPLKNYLFGSSLPTMGTAGGILGGLFGGGRGGGVGGGWGSSGNGGMTPPINPVGLPGLFSGLGGLFGHFANGSDYTPPGVAWVGENGPELVDLPRGARVTSTGRSMSLVGAQAPPVSINAPINISLDARGAGPREVEALSARLDRLQASLPGMIVSTTQQAMARRIIRTAP